MIKHYLVIRPSLYKWSLRIGQFGVSEIFYFYYHFFYLKNLNLILNSCQDTFFQMIKVYEEAVKSFYIVYRLMDHTMVPYVI